jgi:hypothetical protein
MVDAAIAFQVMNQSCLMHRWAVRAAPVAKPWLPDHVTMLTRQAELALLSGDFDHLDDAGGAPLPAKEVSHKCFLSNICLSMNQNTPQIIQELKK